MKVLGLITARGGSKGVPKKNIKILNGRPLIGYVINDALNSTLIDDVVVTTDSPEIASIARTLGAETPFLRSPKLATAEAKSIDVVIDAIEQLMAESREYDLVCLLQPTSPFKPEGFIDNAINKLIETKGDSLVSVQSVPHHYSPYWTFKCKNEYLLPVINETIPTRRQDLPQTFVRDGSIYIFRPMDVLNKLNLMSGKLAFIEKESKYNCNIDTQEDWELAVKISKQLNR